MEIESCALVAVTCFVLVNNVVDSVTLQFARSCA
jgi:hypothetical protein